MNIHPIQRLWLQHAQDSQARSLAKELLSLRAGEHWLELLNEHHYLVGSQLVFNPKSQQVSFRSQYSQEEILNALLLIRRQLPLEHPLFKVFSAQDFGQILLNSCPVKPSAEILRWVVECSLSQVQIQLNDVGLKATAETDAHHLSVMRYPVSVREYLS